MHKVVSVYAAGMENRTEEFLSKKVDEIVSQGWELVTATHGGGGVFWLFFKKA